MRKSIHIILSLLASICLWSCNNDFLEENKKTLVGAFENTILLYNSDDPYRTITIEYPALQNKKYAVWQYPQWMQFGALEGEFKNGTTELTFRLNIENDYPGSSLSGSVILNIDNFGHVQIDVSYHNIGNPAIEVSCQNIDFGKKSEEIDFVIRNTGDGDLRWSVVDYPEWITSPEYTYYGQWGGIIYRGGYVQTRVRCIRGDLVPGIYTGDIVIESYPQGFIRQDNKQITKIPVSMEVALVENPVNVLPIEGVVTAAKFDKNRDLLYVTTRAPSELIVFDIKQNDLSRINMQRISLSGTPGCLTLSEDGNQLFIGCGGKLLHYDAATMNLVKSIELDFIPFDVVYGENDWCYLSPDVNYNDSKVYCVNIKTEETKIPEFGNVFGHLSTRARLVKTPGVSKILATSSTHSPAGVYLFDISQPVPNGQSAMAQYWHEEYTRGRPFWFSGNGDLIYTGDGSVLRNPAKREIVGSLLPIDRFYQGYNVGWIDLCETNHSIWGILRPDSYNANDVFRLRDTDYTPIGSVKPSDYATTINNAENYYSTCAHYVFSNREGTYLFMVKNVNNTSRDYYWSDYVNAWSLECIEIK